MTTKQALEVLQVGTELTSGSDKFAALRVGEAVAIGTGRVPVHRVLGRNAGLMTGPGTNSYLVGKSKLALVDPGPRDRQHADTLLRILEGRPLDWIFVTHTHGDHSPGTELLREETGAEVIGLAPAAGSQHQDLSFSPSRIYRDGEVIDCGEFRVQLVHTPGHVSNHFCFLLEEERMLFTGDHILEGTTPVILPPDGNMRHYLDSLAKLKSLPLRSLAPGHGRLMEDPVAVMETLTRHRLRREHKTLVVLEGLTRAESAVSLERLATFVYDDVPANLLPWAQRTLLAHLLKLEEDGRAVRDAERWRVARE